MSSIGRPAADATQEDMALLERIARRDEGAISALYDRYARLLFGLVRRILHDAAEAEDVLQDVFVAVWAKSQDYDPARGTPAAWLVRIARNRAIDRLRARAVRVQTLAGAGTPSAAPDNPESAAARNEERTRVLRALEPLPAEQRALIESRLFERLRGEAEPLPEGLSFRMAGEGEWRPFLVPGIRIKLLSINRDRTLATLLLEAAPGATFPPHHHSGDEECYVISGSLIACGRRLGPGDFHHADGGTDHGELRTEDGCRVLLVVRPADYLPGFDSPSPAR